MILSSFAFGLCAVALAVTSIVLQRRDPDVNVTGMFDRIMGNRVNRIAVLLMWWWIGWHFLAGQTL